MVGRREPSSGHPELARRRRQQRATADRVREVPDDELPPAIPAATVVLLRDAPGGRRDADAPPQLEAGLRRWRLGVPRRSDRSRGLPGRRGDDRRPAGHRGGPHRGSRARPMEEAGLVVDPGGLVWFAHWTPGALAARRFATWFFMTRAPEGAVTVDDGEIHEHQWIRPAEARGPARRRGDRAHPAHLDDVALLSEHADRRRHPGRAPAPASRRSTSPTSRRVDGGIASIWQGDAGVRRPRHEQAGTAEPPPDARRRVAGRDLLTRARPPGAVPRSGGTGRVVSRVPRRPPRGSRCLRSAPGSAAGSTAPTCRGPVTSSSSSPASRSSPSRAATAAAPATRRRPPPRRSPPIPGSTDRHRRADDRRPKKIDTIPGMPGVPDPSNLYSETAAGKMSDAVKGALHARLRAEPRVEHGVGDRSRRRCRSSTRSTSGLNPQHVVPVVGPQDAVGHQQRRGHDRRHAHADRPDDGQARARRSTVDDPYNMYFTPDGKYAINVAEARKRLDFLDPQTMKVESSLDVPGLRGRQPRRLHDRRPVRDLHLRVRRQSGEDRRA